MALAELGLGQSLSSFIDMVGPGITDEMDAAAMIVKELSKAGGELNDAVGFGYASIVERCAMGPGHFDDREISLEGESLTTAVHTHVVEKLHAFVNKTHSDLKTGKGTFGLTNRTIFKSIVCF